MGHTKISTDIEQNIRQFQQLFADSADIKMKEMRLGKGKRRRCFLAYIEVAVSNMLLETTALGRLLAALSELPDRDLNQVLNENAMGISDVTPYDTIEDAAQGMLTGDAILFVDGYGHALKIADKGYPGMGVQEPDSEKVIRGSKEGFTDSIKTNTALIRKRVRSTRVRVEEVQEGVRSHTAIDLVYMADLKYTSVLEKIREKLQNMRLMGSWIVELWNSWRKRNGIHRFHSFRRRRGRTGQHLRCWREGSYCYATILRSLSFCRQT